jgi:DNA-binding transcriptional regulator YiaG
LTTVELLEAMDASVAALLSRIEALSALTAGMQADNGASAPLDGPALRVRLDLAGLSKTEFAAFFGIPVASVQSWLNDERPTPSWVLPSIHMLELLTPAARRSLMKSPPPRNGNKPVNRHPFSRIDEL